MFWNGMTSLSPLKFFGLVYGGALGNADKDRAVVWILPQEPSAGRFEKSHQIVPPTRSRRGEIGHQVMSQPS